jgi:dUTP pyrophosphatase
MIIKFKKLHSYAVTPSYAKPGDAGLDLTATTIISNTTFEVTYGTSIAVEIPEGYVGLIFPRSSIRKYDLQLSNSVGVIDSGYRGELQFTFNKTQGFDSMKYKIGDRIGQLVVLPYPQIELVEANQLSNTERGEKGFGSSGK